MYLDVRFFVLIAFFFVASSAEKPPHIILVMVDDFGYADVSYNQGNIPTPNIDELSGNGVRMQRYYTHMVCTPSRLSMLTGRYSHLSGFGSGGVLLGPAPWSVPEGTPTLPKELRSRGYSAHAVGKWHLGSNRFKDTPVGSSWGFESWVGLVHGAGGHYSKTVSAGPKGLEGAFYDYARAFASNSSWMPLVDDRHSTISLTDEAIQVMERHAASPTDSDQPLFLYLAYTAAHTPLLAEPEWLAHCDHLPHPTRRTFCGLVVSADQAMKNVTQRAKELFGDNIIVGFASDNGGMLHVGGLNTPLRGGKNMGYEGGVRTIGFLTDMTSSHRYLPANHTYHGLASVSDWMPTLLGIVDHTKAKSSSSSPSSSGVRTCSSDVVPPKVGHGHNLHAALCGDDVHASPRDDAVLVFDDTVNAISYIKKPYKLLIGFMGTGEWSKEPTGRYLYENATWLQMLEEELDIFLDSAMGSRDMSFFMHEVIHVLVQKFTHFSGFDFQNAGRPVLGSAESGDVLASTVVSRDQIPIELYDVWADPSERHNLAASHPEVVADMLHAFNTRHFKDHPVQFDWALTCNDDSRYVFLPQEECARRTSHLDPDYDRRSCTNTIPCRFEAPFIPNEHPLLCGPNMPDGPINLKKLFLHTITATIRKYVLIGLATLLVLFVSAYFLCCRSVNIKGNIKH